MRGQRPAAGERARLGAQPRSQCGDDRPIGRAAGVARRARQQQRIVAAAGDLTDQPCLADAGLTAQQDQAAVAGAPILVGVGAPTSLAVELAADRNMTLAGFARAGNVNVYTGAERVS